MAENDLSGVDEFDGHESDDYTDIGDFTVVRYTAAAVIVNVPNPGGSGGRLLKTWNIPLSKARQEDGDLYVPGWLYDRLQDE